MALLSSKGPKSNRQATGSARMEKREYLSNSALYLTPGFCWRRLHPVGFKLGFFQAPSNLFPCLVVGHAQGSTNSAAHITRHFKRRLEATNAKACGYSLCQRSQPGLQLHCQFHFSGVHCAKNRDAKSRSNATNCQNSAPRSGT